MARKKNTTTIESMALAPVPAAIMQDLNAIDSSSAMQAAAADAATLWRMVGRVEMIDLIQIFGNAAKVAAFETAKSSKGYLLVTNPRTSKPFGSLDEFCEVALGSGYERMRQLTKNRNAVGEELFERAEQLGLRQIDYSAIKALPAPQQEIIKAAIADGSSRDDLVQAIQELAAQDQREHARLGADLKEAQERIAAKEKVAGQSQKTIQRLQEAIAGKPAPSPEFFAEKALRDLDHESLACAAKIEASLRSYCVAVVDADSGVPDALAAQGIAAAVGRCLAAARALAEDFGVAVSGPAASPEAYDDTAEDAKIWGEVNLAIDRAAKNESPN